MMRALCLLPLMLLLATPAAADSDAFKSGVFDPPRAAPEIHLQGSNGAPLDLSAFRGKVVVLGFGYSHCTSVCPITLSNLASTFRKLGAQASEVQLVYVTVDPQRDDAARMRGFLTAFNPTFLGGTGTPAAITAVETAYGVTAHKVEGSENGSDYVLAHSSFVYLIDRDGKIRALVPFGKAPDDIAHDIRLLLKR